MKIIVDNQIARFLAQNSTKVMEDPLLSDAENHISFRWSSLLEYVGLGSLFSQLPAFDQTQPLFQASLTTLSANEEKEVIFYIYDRLFAEILTQIKSLPQINADFLLQAIEKQQQKSSFLEVEKALLPTLSHYAEALLENEPYMMHDLILYLGWDRMCVSLARLFDYQSTNPKFIKGIEVLKDCLLESYQHISRQGQVTPSLYRLLESLLFYQMREENLQKHTDEEWEILSKSIKILKEQDKLADFFYIDDAVVEGQTEIVKENSECCFMTLDSSENVTTRITFVQYMLEKIKSEDPQWNYALSLKEIVYLK